ncbi:MAG: hypothetical protein U0401_03120 [Anaerolineae bacterium]
MKNEVTTTRFNQLVIGEEFRLPGSTVVMIKESLRQQPRLGWVNASYSHTYQEQLCYFPGDTQVVRKRSNEGAGLTLKNQVIPMFKGKN